jgi:hypothetical protein
MNVCTSIVLRAESTSARRQRSASRADSTSMKPDSVLSAG